MKSGAGIFYTDNLHVLLLCRKNGRYKDMWCLPGGKLEPGETEIEAARRESMEECGKCEGVVFDHLSSMTGDFKWTTFFFKVDSLFDCMLNHEHYDWKWVPIAEIKNYCLIPQLSKNLSLHLDKYLYEQSTCHQ